MRAVVGLMVAYILVRATFFAVTWNLEARYMFELAPFIETAAALCVGLLSAPHFTRWAKQRS